jgi:ankyrin repeat protein
VLCCAALTYHLRRAQYGQTALSWAANNGHAPVVQLLLERQASVAARSRSGGNSPLHLAAHRGHAECARLLLDAGADKDARNDECVAVAPWLCVAPFC